MNELQPALPFAMLEIEVSNEGRGQRDNDDAVSDAVTHLCPLIASDRVSRNPVAGR
jgi:hypothetical protein